jgi:hypothetical protein
LVIDLCITDDGYGCYSNAVVLMTIYLLYVKSSVLGCYLYSHKDETCDYFVRSGKVIGRSFIVRQKEHAKCALSQEMRSKFYTRYPSNAASYSNELRLGFFENLTQYCGLGFSRSVNDAYKSLYMKGDSNGILIWDDRILACLKSCSKYKGAELSNGQLHLVGYLFECCYDLAISPSRNVSQNPGFESFVGQLNGGD